MYNKDDKRRLYQLIEMFVNGEITAEVFCSEFYYSYDLEIEIDSLSNCEQSAFSELSIVSSRFSQFQSDLQEYPGGFYNETELKEKVLETRYKLKGNV